MTEYNHDEFTDSDDDEFLDDDHFEYFYSDSIRKKEKLSPPSIDSKSLFFGPPYLNAQLKNRNFDFGGAAVIVRGSKVRLVPPRQSQKGWVYSRKKVSSDSFKLTLKFKIAPPEGTTTTADGLALWFTDAPRADGPAFGNAARFTGLMVAVDTYQNGDESFFPSKVVGIANNGTFDYDKETDGHQQTIGTCSPKLVRTEHRAVLVITYNTGHLKVETSDDVSPELKVCFETDVVLPKLGYIGATAETGYFSGSFDIYSLTYVNTKSVDVKSSEEYIIKKKSYHDNIRESTSRSLDVGDKSTSSIFAVLFIILCVLVFGYFFEKYRRYRDYKQSNRF